MATILDGVADGIVVCDDKLTIVMANLAAATMADWHLEDVTRDELRRNFKFFGSDGITPLPTAAPLDIPAYAAALGSFINGSGFTVT